MAGLHDGHRRRIINKALKDGIESLEEHEIIEILLFNTIPRGNTNEIAHKLLHKFGDLHSICAAGVKELTDIEGIGTKSADFLKMLPLFVKAYELSYYNTESRFDSREALCRYCVNLFHGAMLEEAYLIFLNGKKRVSRRIKLAVGECDRVRVDFKELLKYVVNTGSKYVVLTHNHPNGIAIPSQNDHSYTKFLRNQLLSVDAELYDHIVVAGNEYYSFWEHTHLRFN